MQIDIIKTIVILSIIAIGLLPFYGLIRMFIEHVRYKRWKKKQIEEAPYYVKNIPNSCLAAVCVDREWYIHDDEEHKIYFTLKRKEL